MQQVYLKHNQTAFLCNQYGRENAEEAVIFVHGIGVRWDAKGMFTSVADSLQDKYRTVLFDLNAVNIENQEISMSGLSYQAERLALVLNFVRSKLQPQKINIIAHSFGGLVTGTLAPQGIDKIIINCSPIQNPYTRIKNRFMKREGTEINETGLSKIKRSTGDFTYVHSDFWEETKSVEPLELYKKLNASSDLYYIRALDENVLIDEDYTAIKSLLTDKFFELPGDHDFSGEARGNWIKKVCELLAA